MHARWCVLTENVVHPSHFRLTRSNSELHCELIQSQYLLYIKTTNALCSKKKQNLKSQSQPLGLWNCESKVKAIEIWTSLSESSCVWLVYFLPWKHKFASSARAPDTIKGAPPCLGDGDVAVWDRWSGYARGSMGVLCAMPVCLDAYIHDCARLAGRGIGVPSRGSAWFGTANPWQSGWQSRWRTRSRRILGGAFAII